MNKLSNNRYIKICMEIFLLTLTFTVHGTSLVVKVVKTPCCQGRGVGSILVRKLDPIYAA